ncbi:MAG: DNA-directed RNA polymerase subunit alpha [Candidatus Beckwithbacteria bacterium]|nr:DNA-directed RNA polymerase subunit alpha [Patescibacteria group bacterium]
MIKPNFKTTVIAETDDFGKFELTPLEKGYGQTIGNALRRVLLSSLSGAAIAKVSIEGVNHQFTTLSGVKEDIVELLLNLKQVRLSYKGEKPVELSLNAVGPGEIKAGDIKLPANVKIANKDLVLATLSDKNSKLDAKLLVETGHGYLPARNRQASKLGQMILDASFSPVTRVNYQVEVTRVGRKIDLDKLVMEIYTDGTIKPSKALEQAASILISSFTQIVDPTFEVKLEEDIEEEDDNESLRLSVEELDLPTRIANALRNGGYSTVKELSKATRSDITKVKNLGGKSIDIIIDKLKEKDVIIKK